jgi:hypothetical protein
MMNQSVPSTNQGIPLSTLSTLHTHSQLQACQQELLAWLESLPAQESIRYQVVR